jgi:hypothetical protein
MLLVVTSCSKHDVVLPQNEKSGAKNIGNNNKLNSDTYEEVFEEEAPISLFLSSEVPGSGDLIFDLIKDEEPPFTLKLSCIIVRSIITNRITDIKNWTVKGNPEIEYFNTRNYGFVKRTIEGMGSASTDPALPAVSVFATINIGLTIRYETEVGYPTYRWVRLINLTTYKYF